MSIASEPKRCPKCGAPIPAEAPQGLCPKCLLQEISIPTEPASENPAKPAPPSREELIVAFPHLEILELIGQGGMGFVFKARQPKLDRFVALKILPQSLAADPAFAERFTREGRLLARLNHPNIVTVHDFGQANEFFYLLMEYVDGVNLRQAMRAGRFTPDQALAVVPKICDALQYAHNEGILHRDIKPENILLDTRGRVKIADFGIAKLIGMERGSVSRSAMEKPDVSKPVDTSAKSHPAAGHRPALHDITAAGKTLGTPNYMAPEQIEKPGEVDHRADIYSLGVVFYEMLTGELPRGQFAPPSEKSAADPRLDDVVRRALEKEPQRRTQTAGEVKTQVETIMTGTNQPPLISKSTDLLKPKKFSPHGLMVCSWVFILVVLLTTVVTFLLPETYDAFARIKIENKNRPRVYDPFWLQTEFEIIKSNPVLIRVVQDLKLTERWSLRSGDQEQVTLDDAVGLLRHSMLLRQSRNTLLIEIHAFSENPKEAAEIANAISQSYAAYRQDDARKIEIVNRATPPSRPVRPNKLLNIAIGIFVGIALGALAGLMTTFLLRRKHSPHIAAPPASSVSDRFWKRFAIAVALVLLALILIPVFAILLAIAVPAFQRAHRNSPVASEQSRPLTIKSDYIGQTYFPHRDSIEITSVERSQNEMTVKGHYKLVSEKSADLTLNITSTNKQPDHPGSNQSMHISQGEGDFELSRSNLISGMPHVSMYAHGESFAGIYFGTKEEAEKSKKMIMSSRASAETWSPIVAPGEKPDLQKILDEAKELMGRGQYEEALQRQIWFHNHALEYDQGYTGVRLSFALSQWVELGRRYPKAKEALIEIRDRNARRLAEGNGYADLFADVQAIDNELGDDEATYTLFKTIRENDPKLAKQCYFWMESVLVSKGEYQWCYENMGDPEYRFEFVRRNYETELSRQKRIKETLQRSKRDIEEIHRKNGWTNEPIYSPPDDSARMKKFAEDRFVVQVQQLIEILVGTGHKTDAEKIRDQALAVLDDAQLKSAIGDAEQKVEKKSAAVLKTKLTTRTAEPASELQFRLVLNNGETNVSSDLVTNFLDKSRAVPLHLARNILLDGTAVKAAGWQSISNGFTNFIIEFTEDGSRQFEALTATNLNRQIAVIFQGHVLVAPVIQSRIHTSTLNFPVNWSQKDLERTMNGLNWMHHRAEDLRFGPKQENVLPPLKNKWVFLNLRKNRLATNSYPDVESRAFHDWQRENGADLAATLSEKTPFLLGYGMAVVPAPANGLDNNSPTDIWYNWDLMANEPELKSHLIKNPKTGQDTYFFRTRDDTWGVLQIVGFSENPPGVKVRYKLVQNGEKPSSKK